MKHVVRLLILLSVTAAAWAAPKPVPKGAKAAGPLSDDKAVAELRARASKAAQAKDRKAFVDCMTGPSRALFGKVFPEDAWEPVGIGGRKTLRLIELRRHDDKPWAMAVVPAGEGDGQDAFFARKKDGRWALDQQHTLLLWDTVQEIMRNKKGEKRADPALEAPTLLPRQLKAEALPEGWSVDDPAAEDDWSHLPGVREAFNQKLRGPRDKSINAKFVLFADPEQAEWELWRRKMELGLKEDLAQTQPSMGDSATLGKHSNTSFELLLRKGSTLVIFYANSEDVLPIGQRVIDKL